MSSGDAPPIASGVECSGIYFPFLWQIVEPEMSSGDAPPIAFGVECNGNAERTIYLTNSTQRITSNAPPIASGVECNGNAGITIPLTNLTPRSSSAKSKRHRGAEPKAPRKIGATAATSKRSRLSDPKSDNYSDSDWEEDGDKAEAGGGVDIAHCGTAAVNVIVSDVAGRSVSPITAVQDDVNPNVYLGTADPMETDAAVDRSADPKIVAHRSLFYDQIVQHYKSTNNRAMMSRKAMDELVLLIKGEKKSKSSSDYMLKRDYAIDTFGEAHYSVVLRKDVLDKEEVDLGQLPRYCCYEDLFDAIYKCHVDQEGHSGIRKTEAAVKRHYVNISRAMVDKFIAACCCQLDRKHPAKPDDIKPIISSRFNSRGQVDLINMTAYPDGEMGWILHYQDHHDKMSYLRAMPNKEAKTVALELLPLFLMQGAPVILQSDNGREFVANVITELMKLWKECKIVHGSARHPQSQGSVERANADVESMIMQWMDDHNTTNWTWGIQFIAHKKNNRYHEGVKQIPYVLCYGQACRVGLSKMNLPAALMSTLTTEEDLERVLNEATVVVSSLRGNHAICSTCRNYL
jgi:hypothetical protein